jgi:hypothetical protein
MANTEYASLGVIAFKEFVDEQEAIVELLKIRYRKRDIEMTDLEAWQYMAWGISSVLDGILTLGGPQAAQQIANLRQTIAGVCAAHYRQHKTGVLAMPMGARFDSPEEYQKLVHGDTTVSTETPHVHKGYL